MNLPDIILQIHTFLRSKGTLPTASLLGVQHLKGIVENVLASSLVVFLGKTLNETLPSLCERQVTQFSL